jgi:hypothetical protein
MEERYIFPENNEEIQLEIKFCREIEMNLIQLRNKIINKMSIDGEDFWEMECHSLNYVLRQMKEQYKIKKESSMSHTSVEDILKEIYNQIDVPWDDIVINEELYNKIKEVFKK